MRKWIWMQGKGLLFALPLMLLVFGLYQGYLAPHRKETSIQGMELVWMLASIIIVCAFLHELLHGIGWLLFGRGRECRIVFQRKGFLPVCTCRSLLEPSHYLAGRLLPLLTMGTVGTAILFIYPGIFSFVGVEFILFLCGKDIAEAFYILKNVNNPDRKNGTGNVMERI